jgi:hypothetical protein
MRRLATALLLMALVGACGGGDGGGQSTPATTTSTTVAPTTTTEPDVAATGCKDPTENVDLLVSSSNDRISEAARRYREARSEALFGGDSEALGREVTAGADLMLACRAAGYSD